MPNLTYPGPANIQRFELSNGITLLVYENFAAESVVVEGVVRAGALGEGRDQAGLAGFTADCLLRGTANRDFDAIYEELESVGAAVDISGARHLTQFSGGGLAEELDLVLEIIADALRNPIFPEHQVEQVRGEIMTGLQIRANDTRQMAALAFHELLYQDHPYGYSSQGYPETILPLTRDDLANFHQTYYGPAGIIMAVVGAVRATAVLDRIQALFGDWHNAGQQPLPPVPPAARPLVTLRTDVPLPEKTQADILLGVPGPTRAAPDYLAASMANTILGVFGMMGRLGKNVRERQGLAYYAYSRLNGGLGPSPWYVSTGVAPDKVELALASIRHEIDYLRDELTPEAELADSKAYRTGSLPVGLETNDGLASIIIDMELYGLGLDYLQRFPDLLNAITAAEVQAAAQKYLSADQVAIAVAGPNKQQPITKNQ
jgi:zinc protease